MIGRLQMNARSAREPDDRSGRSSSRLPLLQAAALAAAFAFGATGCGGAGDSTSLDITAHTQGHVVRYTLRCDPARGTVPRPRVLCAALARNAELLLEPREPTRTTRGIPRCSALLTSVRIDGTYEGGAVSADFGRECERGDQPGSRRWQRLLGITGRDEALMTIWRTTRRGGKQPVESISRFDVSVYQPARRFHLKYESGRCEIWIARRANGRLATVKKLRDERPCYASAPWRRKGADAQP